MTRDDQPAPPTPKPVDPTTRPPRSEYDAERILARHAYLARRHEEYLDIHRAEVQRLDVWLEEQTRTIQVERDRAARLLREWHEDVLRLDPRRRKVTLPSGTLSIGPEPRGTSRLVDPEVLLAWAEANYPQTVTPAKLPQVNLAELRKRARPKDNDIEPGAETELVDMATGEVIPGVKLRATERSWEIK